LLRLAGVERLAAISEDYPGSLLDLRHRVPDEIHEVERSLSLVRAAGYELPAGDEGDLRLRLGGRLPSEVARHRPYVAVHPAAAVCTPIVSLVAPSLPSALWRPWRVPHPLLGRQDAPCAGSRARVCPIPGHPCLDSVAPAEVAAALEALAPRTSRAQTAS